MRKFGTLTYTLLFLRAPRRRRVALRACLACKSAPCHLLHGRARHLAHLNKKRVYELERARVAPLFFRGGLRTGTAVRGLLVPLGPRFRKCRLSLGGRDTGHHT